MTELAKVGSGVRIQISLSSTYQKTQGIPPFSAREQRGFVYGFVHDHNLSLYRSGQAGPGTAGDIAR